MTILINLTGDFALADGSGQNISDDLNLRELDAFLGSLRGVANENADVFSREVANIIKNVKVRDRSQILLEINSTLENNVLCHSFKISMEPA